jgi:Gpi18-like mannosyltransferase
MAWIWGGLAAIEPAFRTVTDSSDPAIRALMKVPASLADVGIAAAVGWWFRDRPWAALAAVAAVLLWPVTWYVSAWWGQYESIYVLPAVLAVLAARARLPSLVAVLVAISLMTKPQALPFAVPFAAWFLATQGWRGTLKAAVIGAITIVVIWLPFLAAGGPVKYLGNLSEYQNGVFAILSLGAWNPWLVLQIVGANGNVLQDTTRALGPITLRDVGYLFAALLAVPVFLGVYRRPTADQLALGLAAMSLIAFTCLTTMHERYSYAAFVFLLMAVRRWRDVALWIVVSISILANLLWQVPPPELTISTEPAVAVVGSLVFIGATVVCVFAVLGRSRAIDSDRDEDQPLHSVWPAMG